MLLRITIEDGLVSAVNGTVSGDNAGSLHELEGIQVSDLFGRWPIPRSYSIELFTPGDGPKVSAARYDGESTVFVYYLEGVDYGLSNPSVPFVRLIPDRNLPILSPGFVAMLGYTPWEISQSDLLELLTAESALTGGLVTLLDKGGAGHRLVFSRSPNFHGGTDLVLLQQPPDLIFPVADLERLAGLDVQGPEDLLAFLVDTLDLEAGLLMVRSLQGFVPAGSYNVDLDEEHLENSGLLDGSNLLHPVWVDLSDESSSRGFQGQCLVYPCGELLLIAPWRGEADGLQRRADALMPAVSMRYDQFRATHGEHRLRTLLARLDSLVATPATMDHDSFCGILETAARGFSATVLAVFGPEEAASPVATSRIDGEVEGLLISDRPFEECFEDTHVTVLKDGYMLLAAWDGGRDIPYPTVDSFGAMLKKLDLGALSGRKLVQPDFSSLNAVLMNDTKVIWQGRSMGLSNCWQFYGATRQCADCPVNRIPADGTRSARLENHEGYIEEIHPAGSGFLVTWTKLPESSGEHGAGHPAGDVRFPGGSALYGASGEVLSWTGWFQEASGIGADQATGQKAPRLLDKLGSQALLSQLKSAQAGMFMPEPLEFLWKGVPCYSRMRPAGEGTVVHTILDSGRGGLSFGVPPLGPGTLTTSSEPGSLAEYLSTACRHEGWDFDISGETGENGAPVWLSRNASTDLLSLILHQLAPLCPDRWTGLETGWLDNTPETGALSFLPGRYHVLRFCIQGLGLPPGALVLEKLSILIRGFGGWLAGLPGENVVQIGIPSALERFREIDVLVYSPLKDFTDLCRRALGENTKRIVTYTDSAAEMASSQPSAQTVICRLDQANLHFAAALAVRIPKQPILAASGLSLGLPFGGSGVEHLRLPVDSETLFTAIRRTTRG